MGCPQVVFSVLPSPFEGDSVLIFEHFPRGYVGEHPCVSQGGARPCLLFYCKIFQGSPSSFTPLESHQRRNAIWITEKRCSWGERCFLIAGRPGNRSSASLEVGHPPAALLPNTFLSEFPWSSALDHPPQRASRSTPPDLKSPPSSAQPSLLSGPGQWGGPGPLGGRQKAGSLLTLMSVPLCVNSPPRCPHSCRVLSIPTPPVPAQAPMDG